MPQLVTSNPPFPIPERERLEEYPTAYELTDLGELAAGVPLLPVALNEAGLLVVYGHPPERQAKAWEVRAFTRLNGHLVEHARMIGGVPILAVSATGLLAGQQRLAGTLHAWAAHRGGFGAELWPELESVATGVNSVGEVAGHVTDRRAGRVMRRVFLHNGGTPRFLALPEGASAVAIGVNDSGTVLANCTCGLFNTQSEVVLWWGEAVTRIRSEHGNGLWGTAITAGGRVCGRLLTGQGNIHAFLYEGGRTFDLNPHGALQSEALAANDQRVVVGRCMDDSGRREACRWTPTEGLVPLAPLVRRAERWTLQKAVAVNAAGVIAGTGLCDGALRGFLLTPLRT